MLSAPSTSTHSDLSTIVGCSPTSHALVNSTSLYDLPPFRFDLLSSIPSLPCAAGTEATSSETPENPAEDKSVRSSVTGLKIVPSILACIENLDELADLKIPWAPVAYSWIHPTLRVRRHAQFGSAALFLSVDLPKGTIVVFWSGRIVSEQEMLALSEDEDAYTLQVGENLYQVPIQPRLREPADFTNSSCEPNCGFSSPVSLVTMRDLKAGQEVLFDYAMSESNEKHGVFKCHCGSPLCRGVFTGADWKNLALQDRYFGYFSPYLQAKVEAMRAERRRQGLSVGLGDIPSQTKALEELSPVSVDSEDSPYTPTSDQE
jgi:hypothetical protein